MYFPPLSKLPRRGPPAGPSTTFIRVTRTLTVERRNPPPSTSISTPLLTFLAGREATSVSTSPASVPPSFPTAPRLNSASIPEQPRKRGEDQELPAPPHSFSPSASPSPTSDSSPPDPRTILTITLILLLSLTLFALTSFCLWRYLLRPHARRAPLPSDRLPSQQPSSFSTQNQDAPPSYTPPTQPMREAKSSSGLGLGIRGLSLPSLTLNTDSTANTMKASATDLDYARGDRTPSAGTIEGIGSLVSPVTPRRGWGFKDGAEGEEERGSWWRETRERLSRF